MSSTAENVSSMSAESTEEPLQILLRGVGDALTDPMVERLTTHLGNTLEVVDRLNDDHTRDAVHTLLDELTRLHRAGGLVALFEVVHVVNAMRNALTDGMVERLAIFVEHMMTNLANEEVAELAGRTHEALVEAREEIATQPPASGGLMASLKLLTQPETQEALRFLVTTSKKLQEKAT